VEVQKKFGMSQESKILRFDERINVLISNNSLLLTKSIVSTLSITVLMKLFNAIVLDFDFNPGGVVHGRSTLRITFHFHNVIESVSRNDLEKPQVPK
jgi:hypothetical protein